MDHLPHLRRECRALEAAARSVAAEPPLLPSCPDWTMANLVAHLGWVHRYVLHIVTNRLQEAPQLTDLDPESLPADWRSWPDPTSNEPFHRPIPASMLDWFAQGADLLADTFAETDPTTPVVSWSDERTVGFWVRMQTIEASVHRWDAQRALGDPDPVDADLAADSIGHNIEVMMPARRQRNQVPAGAGERYRLRATDLEAAWTFTFTGEDVRSCDGEQADVQVAGMASQLMLYLWQRIPASELAVTGETAVLDRLFTLAPAV